MDVYKKLEELGIVLEPAPKALGRYRHSVTFLNEKMLYTSGAGCRKSGTPIHIGRVGREVSLEEGKEAARQCIVNSLCGLEEDLGDLNRIKKVVKILGFVSSDVNFFEQPKVLNAASELLYQIFGEDGVGARSAIGVYALPGNIPVEIEMIVELKEPD